MTTVDNKALVRRFYGEGVHNPALFDELLAPAYVLHLPGSPPIAGIEQAKQLMVAYTALPHQNLPLPVPIPIFSQASKDAAT